MIRKDHEAFFFSHLRFPYTPKDRRHARQKAEEPL